MSLMKIKQERLFVVLLCWECPDALRQSPLGEYEDYLCLVVQRVHGQRFVHVRSPAELHLCLCALKKKNKKNPPKQADHRESLQKNVAH